MEKIVPISQGLSASHKQCRKACCAISGQRRHKGVLQKDRKDKIGTKESLVDTPLNFCVLKRAEKLGMVMKMLSGLLRELWRELWNQQK